MPLLFILFFAIALAVIGALHVVLYQALVFVFALHSQPGLTVLRWGLGILSLSFISASIISSQWDTVVTRALYTASAVWIGFLFYLFLASIVIGVVAALPLPASFVPWVLVGARALLVGAILVSLFGLIHARDIRTMSYGVAIKGLPSSWEGKTILFVSDVHLGQVNGAPFAERVVEAIEREHPDMVIIGGDLYDGVAVDVDAVIAPFAKLHSPYGTYFITGNHEEFRDASPYITAIERAGITVLRNKAVDLDGLRFIGVDDKDSTNKEVYARILPPLCATGTPMVLLKHQPSLLGFAAEQGIALQLSGHTHRAQVFPLSYIPKLVFHGYEYGLKPYEAMQVLVSSGVGTWGPPLRVGTDAEIVVIRLTR